MLSCLLVAGTIWLHSPGDPARAVMRLDAIVTARTERSTLYVATEHDNTATFLLPPRWEALSGAEILSACAREVRG